MNSERGWSTYELCKKANIAEATLYSCKRRQRNPSNDILEKICRAYGITLYQFYHDLDGNSELTDEQKETLIVFSRLNKDQREELMRLAKLFIKNNR